MSNAAMFIRFSSAGLEMYTRGEAMTTVNVVAAIPDLVVWLLCSAQGRLILIVIIGQIFSRLNAALSIQLSLMISEDFLLVEEVNMDNLVLGFWLMSPLQYT